MWREVFKNLKISVYEFSLLTALARYQNYILNHLIMVIFRKNWDRKLGRENKKLQVTILLIVGALTSLDLNPIQDGLFRGCLRMGEEGGAKRPLSLKSVTHILQWWNLVQLYLTGHITWVLLTSALFHWKLTNFAISRYIDINYILIRNF